MESTKQTKIVKQTKLTEDLQRQARARLREVPQLTYGYYPTPLEELPRLREALGTNAPRLLIKRDDYTGPGFGGNKVRKLEYVLAQVQAEGAEYVITCGGERSNHARITAALCARLGLRCVLVLNTALAKVPDERFQPATLKIDEMLGADIYLVATREERQTTMREVAERLRNGGHRVAEVPLGGSVPLGALGYVRAVEELQTQLQALDTGLTHIFQCSSSGGTQAGVVAGCQLFDLDTQVIGVSPDDSATAIAAEVKQIIDGVNNLLGLPQSTLSNEVTVLDDYVGPGYGFSTPESNGAIATLAQREGIFLDPVYTAKAMAALLDWVKRGELTADDTVLFWHTGGQMALFYAPMQQ